MSSAAGGIRGGQANGSNTWVVLRLPAFIASVFNLLVHGCQAGLECGVFLAGKCATHQQKFKFHLSAFTREYVALQFPLLRGTGGLRRASPVRRSSAGLEASMGRMKLYFHPAVVFCGRLLPLMPVHGETRAVNSLSPALKRHFAADRLV